MKPRIAYDVSFCADFHSDQKHVTGIGRVIENVAESLQNSPEFQLLLTGCHGRDKQAALTQARSQNYWRDRWAPHPPFLNSVASRTGLGPFFADLLARVNRPNLPPLWRLPSKALNAFTRLDAKPLSLTGQIDLFHSTFRPLPEPHIFSGPTILTVHDLIPLSEPAGSYNRQMLETTLTLLDPTRSWALCISEHTRGELCAATSFPRDRTLIMPLAAESVFRPISDPKTRRDFLEKHQIPDAPYFLSVANPQPRKNIPFLIRCFQEFARTDTEHHLLLAGSRKLGWGHDAIDQQIQQAPDVSHRIHFTGPVSDEELATAYSHCTAFLFPSLQEGFGLPPLEAMQCGAPVICSNTTSLPEVTGDAAILLAPDDARGFVSAMRRITSDPQLRDELKERGTLRARNFSWQKTADIVADSYRRALNIS